MSGSPLRELHGDLVAPKDFHGNPNVLKGYHNTEKSAGAMFELTPPAGMSKSAFIERATKAGNSLDKYLQNNNVPYNLAAVNCFTGALSILENIGGHLNLLEKTADQAGVDVLAGLSSEMTTSIDRFSSTLRRIESSFTPLPSQLPPMPGGSLQANTLATLTNAIWKKLPRDPHIPYPGADVVGFKSVDLEHVKGHHPSQLPHIPVFIVDHQTPHDHFPDFAEAEYAATDLNPREILQHVADERAFRQGMESVLGGDTMRPAVGFEHNGTLELRHAIEPHLGRIIAMQDGELTQKTAHGVVAYNYSDLLVHARDPVQFDADMRAAHHAQEPVALSFQNGQVTYAGRDEVALMQQHDLQQAQQRIALVRD